MLDPEVRRAILARVEAVLDRLEESETAPEGIAAALFGEEEQTPDLYTLLAQLTVLSREVQLQGRAANRLNSEVSDLVARVTTFSESAISARASASRREAEAELLAEILDIRDRFARGGEEARKRLDSFQGLAARLGSRPIVDALVRGSDLALERLDETLRRHGVFEIRCQGEPFDPNAMRAVERDIRHDVQPGMVTEVVRRGYRTAERILRHAEVKVSSGGR